MLVSFLCELYSFVDQLGRRLETERDAGLSSNANICYIVAGNVEQLVERWSKSVSSDNYYFSLQVCYKLISKDHDSNLCFIATFIR